MRSIKWCHFQWPWTNPNAVFKDWSHHSVRSIHSGARSLGLSTRYGFPSVRRRQSSIHQRSCQWCSNAAVQRITVFIKEINSWLSASRLQLNPVKTEIMWLGSGQQINQVDVSDILILSSSVKVVESARDLGVIIDSQLSLSSHVAALCRSGFYHLRQL